MQHTLAPTPKEWQDLHDAIMSHKTVLQDRIQATNEPQDRIQLDSMHDMDIKITNLLQQQQ